MTPRSTTTQGRRIALILSLLLVTVACADAAQPSKPGVMVVATTSILGDIASHVVGDQAEVSVVMPIGVDAHEFQPSAQEASLIAEADLVVANGLGLEQGLVDVLEAAEAEGTQVIELAPLVDPIPFQEPTAQKEEHSEDEPEATGGAEHELEAGDPHFWMDPIRVGGAALALAAELSETYPDGGWQERAADYVGEMEVTDQAIQVLVDQIPASDRRMVTNHEAFGYFAARYGFEIVGVIIPGGSTLSAPSSAELAELVATMEHEGVNVIFAETSQPTALAEAVAAELGGEVEIVELFTESLGPTESEAETLVDMLNTNAERITEALG